MHHISMNHRHIKQICTQILLALGAAIWAIDSLSQLVR